MLNFFKTRFFVVLELVLLIFIIFALVKVSATWRSIQEEIDYLADKVVVLQGDNQSLETRLDETVQESFLELEAKRKLNYRRPGETVFVFYEGSPESEENILPDELESGGTSSTNNFIKWWRYFFK